MYSAICFSLSLSPVNLTQIPTVLSQAAISLFTTAHSDHVTPPTTPLLTLCRELVSPQRRSVAVHRVKARRHQNHVGRKLVRDRHHHRPAAAGRRRRRPENMSIYRKKVGES